MSALSDLFEAARERLSGAPAESLGELVTPRRVLGVARAPRIVPRGVAWHLGVLLVTESAVLATGEIVRSRHEAPRGFTAETQRRRSELSAAAFRGGFAEGTAVHIGWNELDLDAIERGTASGPLAMIDGVAAVRWSSAAGFVPLAAYLDERIALLIEPPQGAT
ncbi:glutaminase [Microbacterium rhizomatis]|uniref:Glutaminase n=1 Tax=Microbacterium rhizomatis TaxID=1631477 RepID=A0A5J5J384_9MICO|nr:glutaminase [Microbacterium rhizomatis]KAA9107890.1 glutaminase [Microbacterium rhizomatis]